MYRPNGYYPARLSNLSRSPLVKSLTHFNIFTTYTDKSSSLTFHVILKSPKYRHTIRRRLSYENPRDHEIRPRRQTTINGHYRPTEHYVVSRLESLNIRFQAMYFLESPHFRYDHWRTREVDTMRDNL